MRWNVLLHHVELGYNSSARAPTGLASNEVHMGRLLRLPLTIFDSCMVSGYQSLAPDHLVYCDLASDREQRVNGIGRRRHVLAVSHVERRNSVLMDACRHVPNLAVGSWAWYYDTASVIRQGAKAETEAQVLKARYSINETSRYKTLALPFSFSDTPDGSPLGDKLFYLDPHADVPGLDTHRRISGEHCKLCVNSRDSGDML